MLKAHDDSDRFQELLVWSSWRLHMNGLDRSEACGLGARLAEIDFF